MIYKIGQLCGGGYALCSGLVVFINFYILSSIIHATLANTERQRRPQLEVSLHQKPEEVRFPGNLSSFPLMI